MLKKEILIVVVVILLASGYFLFNRSNQEIKNINQASISQNVISEQNQTKKAFVSTNSLVDNNISSSDTTINDSDVSVSSSEIDTKIECEFKEMIFYYLDGCSWCQKVKNEDTISKLEELGIKIKQVDANIGPIEHQIKGVPTFVVNDNVYSSYMTFEELKELLGCY